jgi:F-type H+-transporting ATPase subunit epsilon
MADLFDFELVSPERRVVSARVAMVVVPGSEGDFAVLAGHAPVMASIRPGTIEVYASEGSAPSATYAVEGGFAEVTPTGLTILAEQVG